MLKPQDRRPLAVNILEYTSQNDINYPIYHRVSLYQPLSEQKISPRSKREERKAIIMTKDEMIEAEKIRIAQEQRQKQFQAIPVPQQPLQVSNAQRSAQKFDYMGNIQDVQEALRQRELAMQQQQQPSLGNLFGMQTQPMQQQQAPFPGFYGAPQPAQQQPALPNFFGMMQQPSPQPVQPVQQPMQQAFPFNPFLMPQAQQQATPPAGKSATPMLDTSKPTMPSAQQPVALPFFFFAPQTGAAVTAPVAPVVPASALAPALAPQPAAEAKPDAAELPPLDPAAFMQMYMKPGK